MPTEIKTIMRAYKTPLVHKALVLAGTIVGAVAVGTFMNKNAIESEEVIVIKTVTDPEDSASDTSENLS